MASTRLMTKIVAVMLVSRVLLGVHYPSDVVSGALLGFLLAPQAVGGLF